MSTLRIHFDGLCTFAAKNPPQKNGNNVPKADDNNEMSVLLVDARHHGEMPHEPQLILKEGSLVGSGGSGGQKAWDLDREHADLFWIDSEGQRIPLTEDALRIVRDQRVYFDDSGEPANAFPADAKEAEDFSWIPSISQIDPNLCIDPALLQDVVAEDSPLVARMHLSEGTLKVSSFVNDPLAPGGMAAYEFGNGNGSGRLGNLRQALAEGVTAEIDLPEGIDRVEVRLRKLADPQQERRIVLEPSAATGAIQIEFVNRPADDNTVSVSHFGMFYRLMNGNGNGHHGGPTPRISKTNRLLARRRGPQPSGPTIKAPGNADACPFVQGP